jgi:hypothetical protein
MRKVETVLVDDLQGGPAQETVWLMLDGRDYEIDLNGPNAERLRDTLGIYVRNARPGRGAASPAARHPRHVPGEQARAREWARHNGYTVTERGRLPNRVMHAWRDSRAAPVAAPAVPVFTG